MIQRRPFLRGLVACITLRASDLIAKPLTLEEDPIVAGEVVKFDKVPLKEILEWFARKIRIDLSFSEDLPLQSKISYGAYDCRIVDAFNLFLIEQKLTLKKNEKCSYKVVKRSRNE